jgi:hypothetical protein
MMAVFLGACSSSERGPSKQDEQSRALPDAVVDAPTVAASDNPASEHRASATPRCPTPLRLAPRSLAITWQQHAGARVSFPSRVERSVDFTQVVIRARDGARFAVTLGPDQVWSGDATHAFVVGGSTTVRIRGSMVLPLLFVDDDCSIAKGAS